MVPKQMSKMLLNRNKFRVSQLDWLASLQLRWGSNFTQTPGLLFATELFFLPDFNIIKTPAPLSTGESPVVQPNHVLAGECTLMSLLAHYCIFESVDTSP